MKNSLISIVVPVYNVAPFLKRCLDSICSQTYDNLEIILVDDGSTDDSKDICDFYAEKDNRIRVIHKENGGLSDARNAGLEKAIGEFISFIDSDDFIRHDYIQILYELIVKENADISICNYIRGDKSEFPDKKEQAKKKIRTFDSKDMLENWHGKYKHQETVAWNKLYRRKLFVEYNIRYPKGYYNEDVQTTHLLVEKANKIVVTNEELYYYFKNPGSIMGTLSEKKVKDNIFSQKKRLKYFKDNNYVKAYERLFIKLLKYYMLTYCQLSMKNKSKEKLLKNYNREYKKVFSFSTTLFWEKLLFFSFKYFYWIYECVFEIKRKLNL